MAIKGAPNASTIGFTGHVNDANTVLGSVQRRYYDPVAGRFLGGNSVGADVSTEASFNGYIYAGNILCKDIDLDGRLNCSR